MPLHASRADRMEQTDCIDGRTHESDAEMKKARRREGIHHIPLRTFLFLLLEEKRMLRILSSADMPAHGLGFRARGGRKGWMHGCGGGRRRVRWLWRWEEEDSYAAAWSWRRRRKVHDGADAGTPERI